MKPAKVHICPSCSFAPERQNEVVVGEGELVKIERKKPLMKGAKQHVYSQLLFIERERHYRAGWARNQFYSFFGVRPSGLNDVTATPTQEVLNKVKANQIAFSKAKGGHRADR